MRKEDVVVIRVCTPVYTRTLHHSILHHSILHHSTRDIYAYIHEYISHMYAYTIPCYTLRVISTPHDTTQHMYLLITRYHVVVTIIRSI